MKITKELIESLTSETITKIAYDKIISAINAKVDKIWRKICKIDNRELDWYSFSNDDCAYNNGGDGSDGGTFDPISYKKYVDIIGEFGCSDIDTEKYQYENGFPTSLIWDDDYENTITNHILECKSIDEKKKIKNRENRVKKTAQKKIIIESIKRKLSEQELKLIEFK